MSKDEVENLVAAYKLAMAEVQSIDRHNAYPVYPEAITKFMRLLQLPPWAAYDYVPEKTEEIMASIENASIKEVKRALMAAARSERFCDGMWGKILEEKILDPVIERLQILSKA